MSKSKMISHEVRLASPFPLGHPSSLTASCPSTSAKAAQGSQGQDFRTVEEELCPRARRSLSRLPYRPAHPEPHGARRGTPCYRLIFCASSNFSASNEKSNARSKRSIQQRVTTPMIANSNNTQISSSSFSPSHATSLPSVVSSACLKSIPSYKPSCSPYTAISTRAGRSIFS